MELQGGTVTVHSAGLDRGATFRVRLPALPRAAGTNASRRASGDGHSRPSAGCFAGVTIVAIDDDAEARELMGTTLTTYGAKVIVAASVSEGLEPCGSISRI